MRDSGLLTNWDNDRSGEFLHSGATIVSYKLNVCLQQSPTHSTMAPITINTMRRGPGSTATYSFPNIDDSTNISSLKLMIFRMSGLTLNTSEQLLFYSTTKLDNPRMSLALYSIPNNSTIYIRECATFSKTHPLILFLGYGYL